MTDSPTLSLYDCLDAAAKSELARVKSRMASLCRRPESLPRSSPSAATDESAFEILDTWLLDEEQKQELSNNPRDIFFLYATHYLLQIVEGCHFNAGAGEAQIADKASSSANLASRLLSLGIFDKRQAEIVGQIYAGYLSADSMDAVIPPAVDDGANGVVHVQLLAACLRLAAALRIDAPAAVDQLRSYLPSAQEKNRTDTTRHYSVVTTGPHPHVQATVLVRVDCHDAEVHRALKHYESSLQRLLSALNRIVRPRFLYTAVAIEIDPIGYRPIDFKFNVDTSAALKLFMGNTLYRDRRVFLRELVQNAVDACNLRKLKEPGYSPAIRLAFNSNISRITVSDNGIGMSRQWIEKYFLNIGLSFYQSAEIANVNRDQSLQFSFISRFGIGFLSSFLVADKIVVTTRKAGSDGLVITISRVDDYFDVRVVEETIPIGTEVAVHLKESQISYCRSMEYLGYLKTNVRFLSMPVTFVDENEQTSILGQEPMDYSEEHLYGTKFVARLNYHTSRGYLLLRVLENYQYIYDLDTAQGGISVFQDGIFIDQVQHLLPDSAAAFITGRINLVGDEKCELSMDRNHLYWSKEQLAATRHSVMMGVVTLVNELLAKTDEQPLPDNVRGNLHTKLASFFDFNDVDDAIFDSLNADIRRRVREKFRLFVRANRFQFDLARHRKSNADNSHGYVQQWQKGVIDRLMHKKASAGSKQQVN